MRCTWLVLVAVGCGADTPTHPASTGAAWTSGSRIRAQVYQDSAGEIVGLAGRYDTQLDWSCPVDDANPPAFSQCPPQAWWYYRATDCSVHDVVRGRDGNNVVTRFAVAPDNGADHYFRTTQPTTEPIVDRDTVGTCTIPAAGPDEFLVAEIDPAMLALGHVVMHPGYSSLETDDGFQVVLSVDGGQPTTKTHGRIATMYSTSDGVSAYAGMLDTMTGERCYPIDTGSGQLRCLPQLSTDAFGPIIHASTDSGCRSADVWVASQMILGTVQNGIDQFHVLKCDTPNTMTLFGPNQALPHCVQLTDVFLCNEIPLDSFELLTSVTE